jgi:hypothetical protein
VTIQNITRTLQHPKCLDENGGGRVIKTMMRCRKPSIGIIFLSAKVIHHRGQIPVRKQRAIRQSAGHRR